MTIAPVDDYLPTPLVAVMRNAPSAVAFAVTEMMMHHTSNPTSPAVSRAAARRLSKGLGAR